jgi:hypothetical protein
VPEGTETRMTKPSSSQTCPNKKLRQLLVRVQKRSVRDIGGRGGGASVISRGGGGGGGGESPPNAVSLLQRLLTFKCVCLAWLPQGFRSRGRDASPCRPLEANRRFSISHLFDRLSGPVATDPEVQVRFQALPDFLTNGSATGSTQPREYN